jgi:hypothetical protein
LWSRLGYATNAIQAVVVTVALLIELRRWEEK